MPGLAYLLQKTAAPDLRCRFRFRVMPSILLKIVPRYAVASFAKSLVSSCRAHFTRLDSIVYNHIWH